MSRTNANLPKLAGRPQILTNMGKKGYPCALAAVPKCELSLPHQKLIFLFVQGLHYKYFCHCRNNTNHKLINSLWCLLQERLCCQKSKKDGKFSMFWSCHRYQYIQKIKDSLSNHKFQACLNNFDSSAEKDFSL